MKRILAIGGIVVLLALYIFTFITSFTDDINTNAYFSLCVGATIAVPVFIWVVLLFWKNRK